MSTQTTLITFLPTENFDESAHTLGAGDLRFQVQHCAEILEHLAGLRTGLHYHPAVQMWRGYERTLMRYTDAVLEAADADDILKETWVELPRKRIMAATAILLQRSPADLPPHWLGDPALHASHRSRLLTNYPEYYGRFGWKEPHHLPLVWPTGRPESSPASTTPTETFEAPPIAKDARTPAPNPAVAPEGGEAHG